MLVISMHQVCSVDVYGVIYYQVCDVDSDDVYGVTTKPLSSITNIAGMSDYRPHMLTGGAGISELLVRISVKVSQIWSSHVIHLFFRVGWSGDSFVVSAVRFAPSVA